MKKERKEKNGLSWYEWHQDNIRMIELTGEGLLKDHEVDALGSLFLDESHYEVLLEEDANVYKPREEMEELFGEDDLDARLLLAFRKKIIPDDICRKAHEGLREAAGSSKNRGMAAGKVDLSKLSRPAERIIQVSGTRFKYISEDGVMSETTEANPVLSGIVGNFGSNPRNPYCRQTSYTKSNPELFLQAMPFVEEVSKNFQKVAPNRWKAQRDFMVSKKISGNGWALGDTAFTTVTVNKNFQTAVHRDAGDYGKGFET